MNLKSIIGRVRNRFLGLNGQLCFGQEGEDLILDRLLNSKTNGFYVDVGAHHPARFSNTYLFYLRGWSGINIDAQPGSMILFQKLRKRDINIEVGIDVVPGWQTYFQFDEPALNTFNEDEARIKDTPPYRIINKISQKIMRLDQVLEQNLPQGIEIDFFSVDVEGRDLAVLQSNDWTRYRPRFVLAETLRTDIVGLMQCPVAKFMRDVGYSPVSKAYNTAFFERDVG
jgi:hypothetical protein